MGALPAGPSRIERFDEIVSIQGRGAHRATRARFVGATRKSTPRLAFATEVLTTPDLEGRVTAGMRAAKQRHRSNFRLAAEARASGSERAAGMRASEDS